jgi:hypothetical protein
LRKWVSGHEQQHHHHMLPPIDPEGVKERTQNKNKKREEKN